MKINPSEENMFGEGEPKGYKVDTEHNKPIGVVTIKKGESLISMSEGAFCTMYENFKKGEL